MHPERTGSRYILNPVRRVLMALSNGVAILGGLVVMAVAAIAVLSIVGRWLSGMPLIADVFPGLSGIAGDFELIEMGTAVAVFSFLPYTQMRYGHVTVDLLVDNLHPRIKAALTALGSIVFTLVAMVLTWRLALGLLDKISYQETTMILALPIWYGYVPGVFCLALLALACASTAADAIHDAFRADPTRMRSTDADPSQRAE